MKFFLQQITQRVVIVFLIVSALGCIYTHAAFTEPTTSPSSSNQDFPQNILGANNNNNDFDSTNVTANNDGSLIERLEYIITSLSSLWTKVGNLLYYNTGNVGIGTSTPSALLEVSGDGQSALKVTDVTNSITTGIWSGTTQGSIGTLTNTDLRFLTNGTSKMTIDTSGNVGVGTTGPGSLLTLDNNGTFTLARGLTFGDGDSGLYESADDSIVVGLPGGAYWGFSTSQFGGLGSGAPVFLYEEGSATNPTIAPDRDDIDTGMSSPSSNLLSLIAGGVNGLNVNSSGNVGIGSTAPGYALEVNDVLGADGYVSRFSNTSYDTGILISRTDNLGGVGLAFRESPSDRLEISVADAGLPTFGLATDVKMVIQTDGNVGIGTTAPDGKLIINGGGAADVTNPAIGLNNNVILGWKTAAGMTAQNFIYAATDDSLRFGTSNSTKVTIQSNGNVGIGTVSPAQKLEVNAGSVGPIVAEFQGTNTSYSAIQINNEATGGDNWYILSTGDGHPYGGGNLSFYNEDTTTHQLFLDVAGNVGIGTTNPGARLDVSGFSGTGVNDAARLGRFVLSNTNNGYGVFGEGFYVENTTYKYRYNDTALKLGFASGNFTVSGASVGTSGNTITWSDNFNIKQTGEVNKPKNPAFLAYNSVTDANVTGDGTLVNPVDFDTEVFDQGNDFASDTFTAPVTGIYYFTVSIRVDGISAGYWPPGTITLVTSNASYIHYKGTDYAYNYINPTYGTESFSVLADMDAGDTAKVTYQVNMDNYSVGKVLDIYGHVTNRYTFFSGWLTN